MKVVLTCTDCDYREWGLSNAPLMNKIKMWNHVKRAHPENADRLMQTYDIQEV